MAARRWLCSLLLARLLPTLHVFAFRSVLLPPPWRKKLGLYSFYPLSPALLLQPIPSPPAPACSCSPFARPNPLTDTHPLVFSSQPHPPPAATRRDPPDISISSPLGKFFSTPPVFSCPPKFPPRLLCLFERGPMHRHTLARLVPRPVESVVVRT